jgi:hypothetical protein
VLTSGQHVPVVSRVLVSVATWATLAAAGSPDAQAPAVPTFNRDVAPILRAKCAICHRAGEMAPMSLVTYEETRPWARAIKTRVAAREMPPWPADPRHGRFRNEQTLTDAQIETLVAWVDAGAPQGDGTPPPPPPLVDGWTSEMDRPPDMVIEAPLQLDLPPSGVIPEFRIWAKAPFGRERLIEAIELRPTARAVVHHASVFRARLPRGAAVGRGEIWPGGPVVEGVPVLRNGTQVPGSAGSFGTPLVFYVPAGGFLRLPRGVGKRLDRDDYLMWVFHLTTTGERQRAGARLGLWFARGRVEHEVVTWTVNDRVVVNGTEVPRDGRGPQYPNIRPGEADYTVTGSMRVTEPLLLYALWPHMHARGRAITFVLEDRNGREQTLLSIPRYSFNWQFTYALEKPLRIAAGSTIRATARYDNSARNPENPDPTQEVVWGPQAFNEMFDPFVEFAVDRVTMQSRPSDGGGLFLPPN